MKNFELIVASGYIVPWHFKAIKKTGDIFFEAYDPFDSVGLIDSYFPKSDFFTEFERFGCHLEKLKKGGNCINYFYVFHIRFILKVVADVISEKRLVLNPWNIDGLMEFEKETGGNLYNILQLRLNDSVIASKKEFMKFQKIKLSI